MKHQITINLVEPANRTLHEIADLLHAGLTPREVAERGYSDELILEAVRRNPAILKKKGVFASLWPF